MSPFPPSHILTARQSIQTVGATATTACAGYYSGGTLAGAILGTFFGTILLLYLFNSLRERGTGGGRPAETVIVEKRRRRRSHSGSSSVRRPSRVYSSHG